MKYYSFMVGHYQNSKKHWILQDKKIPADSVRSAITLDYWAKRLRIENTKSFRGQKRTVNFTVPDYFQVEVSYRQVIEYERIFSPRRGYTVHQFKKLRVYNFHEYGKYFSMEVSKRK